MCSAGNKGEEPMQVFYIYFDTAIYDIIEKDVKMTLTAYIGVIDGNMGLFTGFSILSVVEMCYYFFILLKSIFWRNIYLMKKATQKCDTI